MSESARRVDALFRANPDAGGAETVVHLAAHYDFTGLEDPEYWRTNVIGLRHVLDASAGSGVRHFVFASSVLACRAPRFGRAITEESPPHGRHILAATKREGEALMFEYSDRLHPIIVRFAPLFSDWVRVPAAVRAAAGVVRGRVEPSHAERAWEDGGAYLHVSDAALFLLQVLSRVEELRPSEVLLASPDGATSERSCSRRPRRPTSGRGARPVHVPKALAGPLCGFATCPGG